MRSRSLRFTLIKWLTWPAREIDAGADRKICARSGNYYRSGLLRQIERPLYCGFGVALTVIIILALLGVF